MVRGCGVLVSSDSSSCKWKQNAPSLLLEFLRPTCPVPTGGYKPIVADFGDYLSLCIHGVTFPPAWVTIQSMLYACMLLKSVRTTGTLVLKKVFMRECSSLRYFTYLVAKIHTGTLCQKNGNNAHILNNNGLISYRRDPIIPPLEIPQSRIPGLRKWVRDWKP